MQSLIPDADPVCLVRVGFANYSTRLHTLTLESATNVLDELQNRHSELLARVNGFVLVCESQSDAGTSLAAVASLLTNLIAVKKSDRFPLVICELASDSKFALASTAIADRFLFDHYCIGCADSGDDSSSPRSASSSTDRKSTRLNSSHT